MLSSNASSNADADLIQKYGLKIKRNSILDSQSSENVDIEDVGVKRDINFVNHSNIIQSTAMMFKTNAGQSDKITSQRSTLRLHDTR